jgi:hypothetical protein
MAELMNTPKGRTPEQGTELRATGRGDDDPVVAVLLDELRW